MLDAQLKQLISHVTISAGGVGPSTSLMEYRLENREFKARVELQVYRALIDDLRLNENLVNYANESFLRETGMNLQVVSASLIFLYSSVYCTSVLYNLVFEFQLQLQL